MTGSADTTSLRWYQGLTAYQWWVFFVAALAWLFDCADQRLFMLARSPALSQLLHLPQTDPVVLNHGTYATAATMFGWAIGGLAFGVLGDRWGRARTLSVSILVYSVFTGLSGLAGNWAAFCLYRFLMGAGIGGAFATAATLVAETVPAHSRPILLGSFSALSAFGNMAGAVMARWLFLPEGVYLTQWVNGGIAGWRLLFFVGALPALLVVCILRTIREPEAWVAARRDHLSGASRPMGDLGRVFRQPRWRRNTLVAMAMATAGIVGVWGVGFWSPELISEAMTPAQYAGKTLPPEIAQRIGQVRTQGPLIQDLGGFIGMLSITACAARFGRRPTFAVAFLVAWASIVYVFLTLDSVAGTYVLLPILGLCTIGVMSGFVIYFPELYPTSLRSTGTALGYNMARVSAAVVMLLGNPIRQGLAGLHVASPFRTGAVALSCIYLLGLIALIWAPETRGQPLPEDEQGPSAFPVGGSVSAASSPSSLQESKS